MLTLHTCKHTLTSHIVNHQGTNNSYWHSSETCPHSDSIANHQHSCIYIYKELTSKQGGIGLQFFISRQCFIPCCVYNTTQLDTVHYHEHTKQLSHAVVAIHYKMRRYLKSVHTRRQYLYISHSNTWNTSPVREQTERRIRSRFAYTTGTKWLALGWQKQFIKHVRREKWRRNGA